MFHFSHFAFILPHRVNNRQKPDIHQGSVSPPQTLPIPRSENIPQKTQATSDTNNPLFKLKQAHVRHCLTPSFFRYIYVK